MLKTENRPGKETLLIIPHLFEVWFEHERIALTATEYDLLLLLQREQDRVLSRSELLEAVWGKDGPALRVVDTFVSRLRKKLRAAGHPGVLSVRKRGYRLAETVGHTQ